MTDRKDTSRGPYADVTIRVFQPGADDPEGGLIYQNRKRILVEYFSDTRYHGYVGFEIQEMYEDMVQSLKGTRR